MQVTERVIQRNVGQGEEFFHQESRRVVYNYIFLFLWYTILSFDDVGTINDLKGTRNRAIDSNVSEREKRYLPVTITEYQKKLGNGLPESVYRTIVKVSSIDTVIQPLYLQNELAIQ